MQTGPKPKPLIYLLMHVGKLLDDQVRTAMADIGIHRGQSHALQLLRQRDGVSQTALTRRMNVAPPTVTGILKRLEAEGLVSRQRQSDDQRVVRVYLTDKGRAIANAAFEVLMGLEQTLITDLGESDLADAHRALLRLRDNLGGRGPEHFEQMHDPAS